MKETRAAGRYALALMDLALEKNVLEKVKQDMDLVLATIHQSREFQLLLSSPIVKADKKSKIMAEIFKAKISDLSLSFINLITVKRREGILTQIAEQFIEQYSAHKGIQRVEVISASGLDEGLRKKVYDLVKNSSRSEIELIEKTDAELIGGFILRIGDNQIDSSIVRSLKRVKSTLSSK